MAEQKVTPKKVAPKFKEVEVAAKGVLKIKGKKFEKGDKVKLEVELAKELLEKKLVK